MGPNDWWESDCGRRGREMLVMLMTVKGRHSSRGKGKGRVLLVHYKASDSVLEHERVE